MDSNITTKKHKIVLATGNMGKCREFNRLLANTNISIIAQSEFNVPKADETGTTLGIEVDCLDGRPGVYSSRYCGENATDEDNLNKLLRDVSNYPESQRTARYWCVLVFMRNENDPTPIICQKSWEGKIILDKRGSNGFGYDPSFLIPILGKTAAEISPELKNKLSHRGLATDEMISILQQKYI